MKPPANMDESGTNNPIPAIDERFTFFHIGVFSELCKEKK